MARLGGWGPGLEAGLTSIVANNRAQDELALRQKAADLAERRVGMEEQRFGMEKDLHKAKMDEVARENQEFDIDEIGKGWGQKDPLAFNYGVDYAARSGFIKTDPNTGKRTIRGKDMRSVLGHMDSAQGVEQISRLKIADLEARIPTITDPAQRAAAEKQLETHKTYNKATLEWMKAQEAAKQKDLDRKSEERRTAISHSDKPGEAEYRKAHTGYLNAQTKYLESGKEDAALLAALTKFKTSDAYTSAIDRASTPEEKEAAKEQLINSFMEDYARTREFSKKRLGGGGPAASGTTYADLVKTVQGAPTTSEAVRRLRKAYGYSEQQAKDILRESQKAGYLK